MPQKSLLASRSGGNQKLSQHNLYTASRPEAPYELTLRGAGGTALVKDLAAVRGKAQSWAEARAGWRPSNPIRLGSPGSPMQRPRQQRGRACCILAMALPPPQRKNARAAKLHAPLLLPNQEPSPSSTRSIPGKVEVGTRQMLHCSYIRVAFHRSRDRVWPFLVPGGDYVTAARSTRSPHSFCEEPLKVSNSGVGRSLLHGRELYWGGRVSRCTKKNDQDGKVSGNDAKWGTVKKNWEGKRT